MEALGKEFIVLRLFTEVERRIFDAGSVGVAKSIFRACGLDLAYVGRSVRRDWFPLFLCKLRFAVAPLGDIEPVVLDGDGDMSKGGVSVRVYEAFNLRLDTGSPRSRFTGLGELQLLTELPFSTPIPSLLHRCMACLSKGLLRIGLRFGGGVTTVLSSLFVAKDSGNLIGLVEQDLCRSGVRFWRAGDFVIFTRGECTAGE